jgi:phage terminase small subunit
MPGTWRSGGRPKPTALKLLQGSRVRGRQREPRYTPGVPDIPPTVAADPLAAEAWASLATRLRQSGVLMTAHGEALATLAHTVADFTRVREQLQRMNFQPFIKEEVRLKSGDVRTRARENPLIRRSQHLALLVSRLLAEFGLTPVSQAKVTGEAPSTPDPFEVFLSNRRR